MTSRQLTRAARRFAGLTLAAVTALAVIASSALNASPAARDAALTSAPTVRDANGHVRSSCTGTGSDGHRVQVLYVHEAGTASRLNGRRAAILEHVAGVDDIIAESAARTGGVRRIRWVHVDCVPTVLEVTVPAGALASFDATVAALTGHGLVSPARKYLAFVESAVLCGHATFAADDRTAGNVNDGQQPGYARVDAPCWNPFTAAHELVHTLGAVSPTSPNGTPGYHCRDGADLMCYDETTGVEYTGACAELALLDCGGDDYFNTAPAPGSWLASHWNIASSSFLDARVMPRAVSLTIRWKARQRAFRGRIRDASAVPVPDAILTLQRRVQGRWSAMRRVDVAADGYVSLRRPGIRAGAYRWLFEGADELAPGSSPPIRIRR